MGDGKFLLQMVIMGRTFKVSLHSWQRGPSSLTLWKLPLYCLYPFFKFCLPPPPTSLPPPTCTPTTLSIVMFLSLNVRSRHIWCAILLNDKMDLQMLSFGTLVPERSWCVFYVIRCHVYRGLTHNVVFYWYSDMTSHTQTYKQTQGTDTVDWHTHINIYLHHLLCSCSSYLCYIKWLNE